MLSLLVLSALLTVLTSRMRQQQVPCRLVGVIGQATAVKACVRNSCSSDRKQGWHLAEMAVNTSATMWVGSWHLPYMLFVHTCALAANAVQAVSLYVTAHPSMLQQSAHRSSTQLPKNAHQHALHLPAILHYPTGRSVHCTVRPHVSDTCCSSLATR